MVKNRKYSASNWGPISEDNHYPQRDSALFRYVFDIPGQYVNDHCLLYDGGKWHLYFIQGVIGTKPGEVSSISDNCWYRDDNEVLIGHAISNDLLQWKLLQPALECGPEGTLDAGHIYAPYVTKHEGQYWMYYAGVQDQFWKGERMFLATSKDLYNWTRHKKSPILEPDPNWSHYYPAGYKGGIGGPAACRDPHVLPHPDYGFIIYYVGLLKGDKTRPSQNNEYGCIAAATSPNLVDWQDYGPVLVRRNWCYDKGRYSAPESPCAIQQDDCYYLFWRSGSGTRYVISDNPLDFRDREAYFLATSHASEILPWNERWFVTSCSRELNDLNHEWSDRTKGLFLAGIEWDNIWPRLYKYGN